MSKETLAIKYGLTGPDSSVTAYRKLIRNDVLEECAKKCDFRASKHGKDDEAENEPELLAAIFRDMKRLPS